MTRPVKCTTFDPAKHNPQGWAYAQIKRDGMWLTVVKDHLGRVTTSTRKTQHDLSWLPALKNVWSRVPPGTTLYGELFVHNGKSSDVITAINERWPQLRFEAFAIKNEAPGESLEYVEQELALWGVPFMGYVRTNEMTWDQLVAYASEHEGLVFKDGNTLSWAKWKPNLTLDAVVVDTKDGNGKYIGLLGALVVGVYHHGELKAIANVSGMSDDERTDMSLRSPIGRVVEVEYQYVGNGGRLRHPRFVRFRDNEKSPLECLTDQDEDLTHHYDRSLP